MYKSKTRFNIFAIGYSIIILILFIYILIKSNSLFFTDDEGYSLFDVLYMNVGYLFGAMPNTHLFNSFFLWCEVNIFGFHEIALRIHSALSFLIYCFVVYKLSLKINESYKRLILLLLLTLHPFLIDYFSLARGYAMSIALMMCSLLYLYQYYESNTTFIKKNIYLAVFFAALSTISCYMMLTYYVTILILYFFNDCLLEFKNGRNFFLWETVRKGWLFIIVNTIFLFGIMTIVMRLKPSGLLEAWPYTSFWGDTIYSIVKTLSIKEHEFIFGEYLLFVLFLLIAIFISLADIIKEKAIGVNSIYSVVFLIMIFLFVIQYHFFSIPYLSNRGSIFIYPILMLIIFHSFTRKFNNFVLRTATLFSLYIVAGFLSINFISNLTLNRGIIIFPNYFMQISTDMNQLRKEDESFSIGAGRRIAVAMNFYKAKYDLKWQKNLGLGYRKEVGSYNYYGKELIYTGKYDYFIISNEEIQDVQNFQKIEIIRKYPEMGLVLAKSK